MLKTTASTLPNDIYALQQLILERENLFDEKIKLLESKDSVIEKKDKRIAHLEQMVRYLKLKQFGKSSERHIAPGQESLFNEAEQYSDEHAEEEALVASSAEAEDYTDSRESTAPQKKKAGRRRLPESLPRHKIYHDIEPADKHCPCGCELKVFDEVTSEQLAVIPAEMYVIQHCRKKYVCPKCPEKAPVTAALPAQPLPKTNASPELLSYIAVSKFLDGLPFYRQEKIWERFDIAVPRATQANWMIGCGNLAQPLVNVMVDYQYQYSLMHIDETPVQVLNEPDKPPDGKKQFWVTVGGPPEKQVFRYHYHPSRGSVVALDLLDGFKGTVMSDDWSVYAKVCEQLQLTHIACNDHARRKFKDAEKEVPQKKKSQVPSKADVALSYYRKLYAIEREIKGLSIDEKTAIRQEKSIPIWSAFIAWMEKHLNQVTPESKFGKALHYTYKLKDKLSYYCTDGSLPMSNEKAENAIRPFAIARKNFLFYDSPKGAEASANLYSLIITAKHHGLNPFYYLAYVFKKLPLAKTVEDIEALLPWRLDNDVLKESVAILN
jgi:transposase